MADIIFGKIGMLSIFKSIKPLLTFIGDICYMTVKSAITSTKSITKCKMADILYSEINIKKQRFQVYKAIHLWI